MPDDPTPAADEALWPDGPSLAQVERWKRRHGGDAIFVTSLTPERYVVWRTLIRADYRRLVQAMEAAVAAGAAPSEQQDRTNRRLVELCVLHPEPASWAGDTPALKTLAQEIMEASGFTCVEVRVL